MKTISTSFFLTVILFLGSCGERLYSLTTVSPGNTYKIRLAETKTEVSAQNSLPYNVTFELERGGNAVVKNTILHSGDDSDPRFGTIAPKAEWISERMVRFGRENLNSTQPYDWLEFHNESSRSLTYAFVSWTVSSTNPNERFLLLDIKPNEKNAYTATSQVGVANDMSVISCQGRFENGRDLTKTTRNFKVVEKYNSPSNYLIKIRDSETLIESHEFQSVK